MVKHRGGLTLCQLTVRMISLCLQNRSLDLLDDMDMECEPRGQRSPHPDFYETGSNNHWLGNKPAFLGSPSPPKQLYPRRLYWLCINLQFSWLYGTWVLCDFDVFLQKDAKHCCDVTTLDYTPPGREPSVFCTHWSFTTTVSTIKLCDITALLEIFLETNKFQNLVRLFQFIKFP